MKKKIFILMGIIYLLLIKIECLAWGNSSQQYNYEITSFRINEQGIGSISGWAILNAGTNDDNISPRLNRGKQSGAGSAKNTRSCNASNDSNTYKYKLEIYAVEKSGNAYIQKNRVATYGPSVGNHSVDLTYEMCYKGNNVCHRNFDTNSPCYDNVGFKFNFDLSNVPNISDGYKFKLTVLSQNGNYSATFDLAIDKNAISDDSLNFVDAATYLKKVKIAVNEGRPWTFAGRNNSKCPKTSSTRILSSTVQTGNYTYSTTSLADGITWYKVDDPAIGGTCANWVPASWIFPSYTISTITMPNNPPENVDTSCNSSALPSDRVENVNSCNGNANYKLNTGKNCTSESNIEYYNISCNPEDLSLSFHPGDFTNLYAGGGFSYDIYVTSQRTCQGTFNIAKWNEAYNKVIVGLNYYKKKNDKKALNEYKNKLISLLDMVKTYNEWYKGLDSYAMDPIVSMKIYQQVNSNKYAKLLKQQPQFGPFEVTNNGTGTMKITKTNRLNFNRDVLKTYGISYTDTINNPNNFQYSNANNPKKGVIRLKKVYINRYTGEISNKNYSANSNWIDGGNKYYTSLKIKKGTYNIKISVQNLGALKNLTVNNDGCSFVINREYGILYRPIDINDPFVSNSDHVIGKNWLNTSYNFSDIIKNDIWRNNSLYKVNLSKDALKEIKKSNQSINGSSEYLGVCYDNAYQNNDYVCNLLKGD